MFKKCGKIMEKHVGQSSALQEIDRWSSCKFSTAGKHSVSYQQIFVCAAPRLRPSRVCRD